VVPVVILAALIYVYPTIHMAINGAEEPTIWPYKKINRGLDLQGGMQLVLEVQTEKAVEGHIERITQDLRSLLRKNRIKNMGVTREPGNIIRVTVGSETVDAFNDFLDKEFRDLTVKSESEDEVTFFDLSVTDGRRIISRKWPPNRPSKPSGTVLTNLGSANRTSVSREKIGF
jgi:preprotein translocase subunit SecD